MAPVIVDPSKVHEFPDAAAFYAWLAAHHDVETEVWIKIHKLKSGRPSVTWAQAIEVALCWGWIDAIRKGFDDQSFLQRYTRRGPKSTWSQINVATVERLINDGRMTPHGLKHVEAAKADGRWDRAYSVKDMPFPADLKAAIDAEPLARAMFDKLSAQNRFAMAFQLHSLKTAAARERKIARFVDMLKAGQTLHPQRQT